MSDDLLREGREMFVFLINEWSELTDADFKDVVELLARIDAHLAQPEAMTPKELAARVQAGERWKIADQPEAAEPMEQLAERAAKERHVLQTDEQIRAIAYAAAPVAAQRAEGVVAQDSEPKLGDPQGRCESTMTERFVIRHCNCGTYFGNLGPCKTFLNNANDRCVYCDHGPSCHAKLIGLVPDTDLRPAPASGLAELAKLGSFQVDWTDDEPAQVGIWKITGSRNDREWHLVAQGESFHAAISALRGQP